MNISNKLGCDQLCINTDGGSQCQCQVNFFYKQYYIQIYLLYQGSKGNRQCPMNTCTPHMMIHKITPFGDNK